MLKNRNFGHLITVLFAATLVAFAVFVFDRGLRLNPRSTPTPLEGKSIKAFNVKILQGRDEFPKKNSELLTLEDLKGTPLVLNFWASWCTSCREEAHIIERFWKAHRQEGIKVIGIAVYDDADTVLSFVKSMGKSYVIGLDEEGKTALDFGVTGVPETVFIDRDGVVVHKEGGPIDEQLLQLMLTKLNGRTNANKNL